MCVDEARLTWIKDNPKVRFLARMMREMGGGPTKRITWKSMETLGHVVILGFVP